MNQTIAELLIARSDVLPVTGCVIWTGGIGGTGYGRFRLGGKTYSAHREAYRIAFGDIPEWLYVCHRCDVRLCINPNHLFAGSHSDNMSDMVNKGRSPRAVGEKNGGGRKLTEVDVLEILKDRRKRREIAEAYGISVRMVGRIRAKERWAHLSVPV